MKTTIIKKKQYRTPTTVIVKLETSPMLISVSGGDGYSIPYDGEGDGYGD